MENILASYSSNWADEMDVSGFRFFTAKEWEAFKAKLVKFFEVCGEFRYGVGTNESIDYSSAEQLLSEVAVTALTDLEVDVFKSIVKKAKIHKGFFPDPFDYYGGDEEDWPK